MSECSACNPTKIYAGNFNFCNEHEIFYLILPTSPLRDSQGERFLDFIFRILKHKEDILIADPKNSKLEDEIYVLKQYCFKKESETILF